MKKVEIKNARFLSREALNCSQYGNPRSRVWFARPDGEEICATTATDAACGYAVRNWESASLADIVMHYTRNGNAIIDYITPKRSNG